jgi:hypothetical protein
MQKAESKTVKVLNMTTLLLRLGLGLLLVWSSIGKIEASFGFLGNIYEYRLVGPLGGLVIAIVLPWLEMVTALLLFADVMTDSAFIVVVLMGFIFLLAQITSVLRGMDIPCGCFGSGPVEHVGYWTIIRAVAVILAGGTGYFIRRRIDTVRPDLTAAQYITIG